MNQKGFTLVELLGVIVILGIVLNIAIPAISNYIEKSRREAFVSTLNQYVEAVQRGIIAEEYSAPINSDQATIVSLNAISLDKGKFESSYQSAWIKSKSYVIVINVGTSDNINYEYYVAAQDEKDHAVALIKSENINRGKVISNAKNKMEVTIQALCGNETGKQQTLSTIKGLEEKQPTNEQNQKIDWQAVIYSGKNCAS